MRWLGTLSRGDYLRQRHFFSGKGSLMTTAETYCPLPFSSADFRRLKKSFRVHAPHLELDLGDTETGEPFISVTIPGAGFDDAPPCQEVAEFFGSGMSAYGVASSSNPACRALLIR